MNAFRRLTPPPSVERILIVGAGGFGREVFRWLRDSWPEWEARIAGFLSDDLARLDGFETSCRVVGTVRDHVPIPDTAYLLAIGVPYARRRVAESIERRGGRFVSLVHPSAVIGDSAVIGEGAIVCPNAVISDSSRVGRCVLVNYLASLGHDAAVGDYAVLSPYSTLGGAATVGSDVFLGLHASVGPGVAVGERSKISANSCALASVPPDSLVYGVPGRCVPRVDAQPLSPEP